MCVRTELQLVAAGILTFFLGTAVPYPQRGDGRQLECVYVLSLSFGTVKVTAKQIWFICCVSAGDDDSHRRGRQNVKQNTESDFKPALRMRYMKRGREYVLAHVCVYTYTCLPWRICCCCLPYGGLTYLPIYCFCKELSCYTFRGCTCGAMSRKQQPHCCGTGSRHLFLSRGD